MFTYSCSTFTSSAQDVRSTSFYLWYLSPQSILSYSQAFPHGQVPLFALYSLLFVRYPSAFLLFLCNASMHYSWAGIFLATTLPSFHDIVSLATIQRSICNAPVSTLCSATWPTMELFTLLHADMCNFLLS